MLYLFDLDGTLISSYMDNPDRDYTKWSLLPGRKWAMADLVARGDVIGIISNQAGVGLGYITQEQVHEKMNQVLHELGIPGAPWRASYAHEEARCPAYRDPQELARRKPSGAMIQEIVRQYPEAAAQGVLYVGDTPADYLAARDASVGYVDAGTFFAPWREAEKRYNNR